MVYVTLRIEPELCGPLSVGTVKIIRLISEHLGIGLAVALGYVDRCVFEAEELDIPAPSAAAAARLLSAISALPPSPRVVASVRSV